MSDIKFVMMFNVIMRCCYFVCVTVAAMHFEKPTLLFWYLMALLMGWTYQEETKKE